MSTFNPQTLRSLPAPRQVDTLEVGRAALLGHLPLRDAPPCDHAGPCGVCGHSASDHRSWTGLCVGTVLGSDPCMCARWVPETEEQRDRREAAEDRWLTWEDA